MIESPSSLNLRNPVHLLAFGFGSGLAPKAPGTFGTLAALPFWLLLAALPFWLLLAVLLISFIAGCYICGKTAEDLGVHDYGGIVWDEFVGLWLTLLPLYCLGLASDPLALVLGFVLFRFFDIVKPWPIKWADAKVDGGLGIMLDDVLAAMYAGVLLWLAACYCL